jgi:hypothetical protein
MVKRNIPDWQISAFDKDHNSCVKTKPNNKDHNKEIKEVVDDFISVHGEMIKKRDPETYYSLMDKKLPKKYQKKDSVLRQPVNAYIPPQSKLTYEELEASLEKEAEEIRIKEKKLEEEKKAKKVEELRIERNRAAALRESKYIGWTDAHKQGRWRSIHSEEYQQKVGKKNRGYY